MKVVSKSIIAAVVALTSVFASAGAGAANFNPFTVVSPNGKTFTADKITGNFNEVITFNQNGTFDVSLYFEGGQFVTNQGQTALKGKTTGLGAYYGLYALYKTSGMVNSNGGNTIFSFKPGAGSLNLFLDAYLDTEATRTPATGTGDFTLTDTRDDVLLAFGKTSTGAGSLTPGASTCGWGGINCGSFGSTSSFNRTNAGTAFFVSPASFFNISFQSGQLNIFNPTRTQTINGSMDVVFNTTVPEPASLGLLGLGLAGLAVARRRKGAR